MDDDDLNNGEALKRSTDLLVVRPKFNRICGSFLIIKRDDKNSIQYLWLLYDQGAAYKQYLGEGLRALAGKEYKHRYVIIQMQVFTLV